MKTEILRTAICLALTLAASRCLAESQAASAGHQWAVLIGCEKYHRANPLRYTVNDVRQVGAALRTRGGYEPGRMFEMTDVSTNDRTKPLKANVLAELPNWLKKPRPEDTIVIYFSGHGFRDADNKMYLAPLDVDPANPEATGIPIEWFREQIANCPAGFKLLVIDACHAGSEKGDDEKPAVATKDLVELFQGLDKVVTIASSTADQKSQIWEDKQQSLFSYWLTQGIKGHADSNGDGNVDIDELYRYVSRTVSHTAEQHFPRKQNPVRIVRSGTIDVPVVVYLKPQPLKQVLSDMAEQLADAMADRQLGKVGVLEFINVTSNADQVLRGPFGLLGRYCAADLERRLIEQGTGKFSVVDGQRLQKSLKDNQFKVSDLSSAVAIKDLAKGAGGMPVIVEGTLRGRAGSVVHLECKLQETGGDETLASVGGIASISESEWAMLGGSAVVKPEDRRPAAPSADGPPAPAAAQVITRLDERAQGPHPLADPSFKFRVWLNVGQRDARGVFHGEKREGVLRGNDYFVPVREGEVYEIWVENLSGELALMRLLVDGLNTLPEKEPTKGLMTVQWGQRVNLDEARTWELDPAKSRVFAVRGFVTEANLRGKVKQFTVVDAAQSLAASQQFSDQIGMITAAFYGPKAGARGSLGTAAGNELNQRIGKGKGYQAGNLLGVVNIRYVDAAALPDAE